MKDEEKQFVVYDPIFKQEVNVFINQPYEKFIKWQKKIGVVNLDDDRNYNFLAFTTHIDGEKTRTKYVIWISEFDWTLDNQETLVHEIVHAVIRIWDTNNIELSKHTQEFFAHSVGRLYSDIGAKLFNKKRIKRS